MRRLALFALLLPLAACDVFGSDIPDRTGIRVDQLSHDPAELVGVWELVTVTGSGQSSEPQTAAASGERYEFSADGTARVEIDGQAPEDVAWQVTGPAGLRIGAQRETFGIDGDHLYFDGRPVDGVLREFERQ